MQRLLRLYWNTLRYLRPHQIYARLWAVARRRLGLYRMPRAPQGLVGDLARRTPFLEHQTGNGQDSLQAGRFTFLGCTVPLGYPPQWRRAARQSLLWQFHLHYFHYLPFLAKPDQEPLCEHWVDHHLQRSGVGWHPYTTSLRLVQWIKAGLTSCKIQQSIYEQAAYLSRNVETYQPGNHLLENARALVFAGLYSQNQGESAHWLQQGVRILARELPQQTLDDGVNFELSPMYHALMLELVLDLCNVLPLGSPLRATCVQLVPPMLSFLRAATHPDGGLALFNDSTLEVAPSSAKLEAYAARFDLLSPTDAGSFTRSGYFIHRDDHVYLMVDGGPIGPNHLPAHAHADIFSFEFSLGGQRVLVDAGTFEYQAGPARDYGRSTRAHNTVSLDGLSQAEVWSSFRVARRFPPAQVQCSQSPQGLTFWGRFDGWARLIGDHLSHSRSLSVKAGNLTILDTVEGEGYHLVEARYHLHPDFSVELFGLTRGRLCAGGLVLTFRCNQPVSLERTLYSPRFGEARERTTLCLSHRGQLPKQLEFSLEWETSRPLR